MPLDRRTVDRLAGEQIRDLMKTRNVTPDQKRQIRRQHEQAAQRAEKKSARR